MSPTGKYLIIAGAILILGGLLLDHGGNLRWVGRLPGDIRIERNNFSFFFPFGTCLLLSALFSLILWLWRK